MQKLLLVWGALLLTLLTACGQSQSGQNTTRNPDQYFSDELDPSTQGSLEQSVGYPWGGKLINAVDIGFSGPGYIKLFHERHSGWTTFDLYTVIKKGLQTLESEFPNMEPVQIGDLSARYGGPLGGHESHQSGIDADIRFLSKDHRVQIDSNTGFSEQFVIKGKLSPNFDLERNWAFVKGILATGRVNRIFMASPIKKGLCRYLETSHQNRFKKSLHKIQILENHTDHLHLRITCPINSPKCEKQDPLPDENDCP